MADSLTIADTLELLQGGAPSQIPECAGAVFRLQPGWGLGASQPDTDTLASLALDGEIPLGRRASNRTITLPVLISASNRILMAAAREVLLRTVDQPSWTLRWTRDGGLAVLFDCYRAGPAAVTQNLQQEYQLAQCLVTVTFSAKPYARSPAPVTLDFPSPVAGVIAPPAPLVLDSFTSVSGIYWQQAMVSVTGAASTALFSPYTPPGPWQVSWHGNGTTAFPGAATVTAGGVVAGRSYQAATLIYSPQGWSGGCAVNINWFTSGGSFISTSSGSVTALPANTPVYVRSGTFTAPAGAARFSVIPQALGTPSSSVMFYAAAGPAAAGYLGQPPVSGFTSSNSATVSVLAPWASNPETGNGAGITATYVNNTVSADLTGQQAITFWAGLCSQMFYANWCKAGGPVRFTLILTDATGATVSASLTRNLTGGQGLAAPRWAKIRIPLPPSAAFDYTAVAGYSVIVTNRAANDTRYVQVYLDTVMAVPPAVTSPSPQRGTVYDLAGITGSARAPVSIWCQQPAGTSQTYTRTVTVSGPGQWQCPPGVTSVSVFADGAGGAGARGAGGNGGGGGGGGGSASNAAVAVTPGNLYSYAVGAGGIPAGADGGNTTFTGDSVTVTAHGGHTCPAGTATGAAGGAAGTGGFAGGTGGSGGSGSGKGGGGGGGSGGSAAAGNNGGSTTTGTGGAGGAAVTGGGPGGRGGTFGHGNGIPPTAGYGGGGGGSPAGSSGFYYPGYQGCLVLTYTQTGVMATLIAHRPSYGGPESLCPFVSPNIGDTPDGTIQYPVTSLVPGLNARFDGTYTIVAVAWQWDNPSAARTVTVSVSEWASPGVLSASQSVSASVTPSQIPGPGGQPGLIAELGELTLPSRELPPTNTGAFVTVSLASTDTADAFMDILFLDSQGSTVLIQGNGQYANFFLDEASDLRDIGYISGSQFDRSDAVSVLADAVVSGGPLSVDPYGNQQLLVYAAEGSPSAQVVYSPRWYDSRLS